MAWSHCSGNVAVSWHDLQSSSDKSELNTLLRGQNSRKVAAPQPQTFLALTDSEMEAQQLAVVQPAGCCVSIEDGSTRYREGVLARPPERFTLRAQLLTAQRVWSGRGHVYAAANITELHRAGQAALLLEPATRLLARDNVLHPLPAENEGAIASARTRDD